MHEVQDADAMLDGLQREVMKYFEQMHDPHSGLVADSSKEGSASSIAAVGLGLASFCCASESGHVSRTSARDFTLRALRTLSKLTQSEAPDASGFHGFFYHFLDMKTGRRANDCELSSIDTALLVAGALVARQYFDGWDTEEAEIRLLADQLYRSVEWDWMMDGGETPRMAWKPVEGFSSARWNGYNEGLLLMILGLGSPTHPLPAQSYPAYCSTYEWIEQYGQRYLHAPPLFVHQFPACWIDFRGIADDFMRARGSDYFINGRQATLVHQAYAIENPGQFMGYGAECWGLTASKGPGPAERVVKGRPVQFLDYTARGPGPAAPDDGSIAPWAVAASLPFAPAIVLPTIRSFKKLGIGRSCPFGFESTFNQTFEVKDSPTGFWMSPDTYGLNQGPIVLMVQNYRSGLIWRLMRHCSYVRDGLLKAGFRGGWLGPAAK